MKDEKKFRITVMMAAVVILLSISYSVFQEYFAGEVIGYINRRVYYYRAISNKGLSLHKGEYWRKSH